MGDVASDGEGRLSRVFVLRLKPGADLKTALMTYATEHHIGAAVIATCVGSLSTAYLRYAGQPDASVLTGDLEIVSLIGTLGRDGMHVHLAVSDAQGRTFGGHLMDGCIVRTTAEIAIAVVDGIQFQREVDPQTGYRELRIEPAR